MALKHDEEIPKANFEMEPYAESSHRPQKVIRAIAEEIPSTRELTFEILDIEQVTNNENLDAPMHHSYIDAQSSKPNYR